MSFNFIFTDFCTAGILVFSFFNGFDHFSHYRGNLSIPVLLIFKAMMMKPMVGKEAMLGKAVVVIKDIAPEGKIKYATEIWNAMTDEKVFSVGEKVIIHGFWGMNVLVKETPIERKPGVRSTEKNHR